MKKILDEIKTVVSLRSLQARIFAIILVVGIAPGVLLRYGILNNYEQSAVENRIATVQNQLMIVGNHLLSNNYFTSAKKENGEINAELEMISNLYEGRVMVINSGLRVVKDTYGISGGKIIVSEEVVKCFRGESTSHYDKEHGYIEMTTPIVDTSTANSAVVGVMLTSISNDAIVSMMEVLNRKAVILEYLMMVGIVAVALLLSQVLTNPFNKVTSAINEVKAGYTDENISVPDYVETVHIVDAFNQMLMRMRAQDESREEFVANVSHELKTPMASIKVLADSLLAQENAPAELYREFMEDIVSEIDRENQIITDLLALVKMDKKNQEAEHCVHQYQ